MPDPASMSPTLYFHRQTGRVVLAVVGTGAFCLSAIALLRLPDHPAAGQLLLALGIAVAVGLTGPSLQVTLTQDRLVARFGIGILRRTIALADISDVAVVRTRWYEGWGVHWTRRGMLYNVAGFDAVRIALDGGRSLRIGSDDAPGLAAALRNAIGGHRRPVGRSA